MRRVLIRTATGTTAGSAIGESTRANIFGAVGGVLIGGITGHEINLTGP